MVSGAKPVDGRADRVVQTTVAVVTLSAFVFRQQWVVPVLAVLLAGGAIFGPRGNPFHRAYAAFIAPRLGPGAGVEDATTVQAQDILGCALLGVATLCIVIGIGGVAWIVTLAEGVVAAVAATTGVHLGVTARDRFRKP